MKQSLKMLKSLQNKRILSLKFLRLVKKRNFNKMKIIIQEFNKMKLLNKLKMRYKMRNNKMFT